MFTKLAKFIKYTMWFLLLPIGLFVLYTWLSLTWIYSTGERVGYVQKLSKKGWVCKTHEGDLILVSMPGTQAEKFLFTVHDAHIAKKINNTVGKRVRLFYEQHIGIPSSCFGDTQYFVTDVQLIEN